MESLPSSHHLTLPILVLLTGASGFLASHIGLLLLQRGFRVRRTVRSTQKGEYRDKFYKDLGLEGWEWVVVEDVEKVRLGPPNEM